MFLVAHFFVENSLRSQQSKAHKKTGCPILFADRQPSLYKFLFLSSDFLKHPFSGQIRHPPRSIPKRRVGITSFPSPPAANVTKHPINDPEINSNPRIFDCIIIANEIKAQKIAPLPVHVEHSASRMDNIAHTAPLTFAAVAQVAPCTYRFPQAK